MSDFNAWELTDDGCAQSAHPKDEGWNPNDLLAPPFQPSTTVPQFPSTTFPAFTPTGAPVLNFDEACKLAALRTPKLVMLKTDERGMTAADRKNAPVARGVLDYFPDALLEVANLSRIGNEQHNPGQPMHWAREKSTDHADCIIRHLIDRGTIDTDGVRHAAKVAWRALALLQLEIEASRGSK